MNREEITAYLRSVPNQVQALCQGVTDEQLRVRPMEGSGEAGWSLIELICHLRDSAEEDGTRIRRLVEGGNPTLVPYDQDAWAIERNYQGDDPRKALIAMRAFWTGLAYQLENLSDDQWSRAGVHPEQGPVTVRSYAEGSADHGRAHVEQMRGVRTEIG